MLISLAQAAQQIAQTTGHVSTKVRLEWDGGYILIFTLGQLLFVLKRADLARRSPLNGVKSIPQYLKMNWVVLVFRTVIEWGIFLDPYRTWKASTIQTVLSKIGVSIPFQIPDRRGLVGAFFLGMAASSFLDWIMGQKWVSSVPVLNLLKENIPQLPEVQQLVSTLGTK